jgi:chromosome segregation ATPase
VTGRLILHDYHNMNDTSNDRDAHGEETHIPQMQSDIDFINGLLATQHALRCEVNDLESQLATQRNTIQDLEIRLNDSMANKNHNTDSDCLGSLMERVSLTDNPRDTPTCHCSGRDRRHEKAVRDRDAEIHTLKERVEELAHYLEFEEAHPRGEPGDSDRELESQNHTLRDELHGVRKTLNRSEYKVRQCGVERTELQHQIDFLKEHVPGFQETLWLADLSTIKLQTST